MVYLLEAERRLLLYCIWDLNATQLQKMNRQQKANKEIVHRRGFYCCLYKTLINWRKFFSSLLLRLTLSAARQALEREFFFFHLCGFSHYDLIINSCGSGINLIKLMQHALRRACDDGYLLILLFMHSLWLKCERWLLDVREIFEKILNLFLNCCW